MFHNGTSFFSLYYKCHSSHLSIINHLTNAVTSSLCSPCCLQVKLLMFSLWKSLYINHTSIYWNRLLCPRMQLVSQQKGASYGKLMKRLLISQRDSLSLLHAAPPPRCLFFTSREMILLISWVLICHQPYDETERPMTHLWLRRGVPFFHSNPFCCCGFLQKDLLWHLWYATKGIPLAVGNPKEWARSVLSCLPPTPLPPFYLFIFFFFPWALPHSAPLKTTADVAGKRGTALATAQQPLFGKLEHMTSPGWLSHIPIWSK